MKRFLPLLLILICISCGSKQEQIAILPDMAKNHLQRNTIHGNVESILTRSYFVPNVENVDSADVNKVLYSVSIQHYNPEGYLTSVIALDDQEDTVTIRKIFYLENGKQAYWILMGKDGEVMDSCHYDYDISGFLSAEKRYSMDTLYSQINYKTDALGNVIEMIQENARFSLRNTLQYDNNGLLIRSEEYAPDNKLFKIATIEYDSQGREVNRKVSKRNGDIIEYTYTQYDDKNRIISKIYEDRNRHYREDYNYSDHDESGNWRVEYQKKENKITYIRVRNINYY